MELRPLASASKRSAKGLHDLNLIRLFIKVAELGVIAAAARELSISSSFANRRMALLSERLGAQLFIRSGRRLKLTAAGERYLTWANESLASYELLSDDLDAIANQPSGIVRFACYTPALDSYLIEAMKLFNEKYPEITVEVTTSDRPIRLIAEGYDIAIHAGPMPDDGNFVTKLVQRFDRLICASPDYIARNRLPRTPRDLLAHRCLIHSQSELALWNFIGENKQKELVTVRSRLRSNSYLVLRELALRGLGVVRIGENLVRRSLDDGSLVRLLPNYRCISRSGDEFSVRIIYPSHKLPLRVRVFERHLFSLMKQHWKALKTADRSR